MTLKEALERKASKYAEKAHKGQVRKIAGEEYIEHPRRVAEIVRRFKSSHKIDELISVALLHDTIEDTGTTEKDLHKLFGGLTASLVRELTSDKNVIDKIGKKEYLTDKIKNMSSWALVVKLADRLDNVSDLKAALEKKPEFAERYAEETKYMLNKLEAERKLTNTQQKIVKAIKDKLEELKLNEAFEKGVKRGNEYHEIFKNPSLKEIKEVVKNNKYRVIIDIPNKNVYAFNPELMHYIASNRLGRDKNGIRERAYSHPNKEYLFLVPIFKDGKSYLYKRDVRNYLGDRAMADKLLKQPWFKKYFEAIDR